MPLQDELLFRNGLQYEPVSYLLVHVTNLNALQMGNFLQIVLV